MSVVADVKPDLISGYVAVERLGAGGYGEVWKVEAPGGLLKAVKVIYGYHSEERAARELKALEHIRAVRHPFLLSLERIEVYGGRLMIVTELADESLMDRFEQCRKLNLPGIPRDELLGYLHDAAEALDFMWRAHSLQHLDVKPENLLVVAGRTKVADFGLVKEIEDKTRSLVGAMTPTYAAPELFDGRASRHSDQYSLAIVYQELLTGVLPFPGRTAAQLAAQHTRSKPQVGPLPASERELVERALAKRGEDRFGSCLEFIEALQRAGGASVAVRPVAPAAPARPDQGTRAVGLDDTQPNDAPVAPVPHTEVIGQLSRKSTGPAKRAPLAPPPPPQTVVVSGKTRPLPPPTVHERAAGVCPALFVGVGGTGALVLEKLQRRLVARFGAATTAEAFPLLLIDVDSSTIKQVTSSGFDPQDTALLTLKHSHEYRNEADELLEWIPRRWLYNIPKDGLTGGARPLGRLALVDRAGQLVAKLRQRLTRLVQGHCAAQLAAATGETVRQATPRVILVGSCNGGTGGGMLLELAYAVRNLARQASQEPLEVRAVVTNSTNQCPTSKQLSIANALAFLQEMQHFARVGAQGDSIGNSRTQMFEGTGFPLDDAYLLDLGDELTTEAYDRSLEGIADYLYCDVATVLGGVLDTCRKPAAEDDLQLDMKLRSFRLARFEGFDQALLPTLVEQLVAETARWWFQEAAPATPRPEGLQTRALGQPAQKKQAETVQQRLVKSQAICWLQQNQALIKPRIHPRKKKLVLLSYDHLRPHLLRQLEPLEPLVSELPDALAHLPRQLVAAGAEALQNAIPHLAVRVLQTLVDQANQSSDADLQAGRLPLLEPLLREAARREAAGLVRQLVSGSEVTADGVVQQAPAPVVEYVAERAAQNFPFGCGRRLFLLASPQLDQQRALAGASGQLSACLEGRDIHSFVCEELEEISLAQRYEQLQALEPQALEAADHLHNRSDIAWTPPARPMVSG